MTQQTPAQTLPIAQPTSIDQECPGYPKLARLMATSASAAIFRKFAQLQVVNLLRLQARLQNLEEQYCEIRRDDANSGQQDRIDLVRDFFQMTEMAESVGGESEQNDVLNEIQEALKEYNEALVQVMRLDQAQSPSTNDIRDLRSWLERPTMGDHFLRGTEAFTWDETNDDDFINPRIVAPDKLTSLLTGSILDAYHWAFGQPKEASLICQAGTRLWPYNKYKADRRWNKDPKVSGLGKDLRLYDNRKITAIADVLAAVISSLLPTVMILVLYFVHSMLWRLGLLIIFTAVFSASITVFTNAKKIEVYSATAAFAAVEVVFIGSTASAN